METNQKNCFERAREAHKAPRLYYKFYNSFSHESDLRLAVGNCSLHSAPQRKCPHHSASQHSPRQTSDAGFEAHILKAERRLHTLDVVSQPSRTFESPRARRDAPNKRRSLRRSLLKWRVRNHDRIRAVEASQPSRTFESPRARRDAQEKRALVGAEYAWETNRKNDFTVHAKRTRQPPWSL